MAEPFWSLLTQLHRSGLCELLSAPPALHTNQLFVFQSHKKVGALWRESGLSWKDYLPEGEDVQTFLMEQVSRQRAAGAWPRSRISFPPAPRQGWAGMGAAVSLTTLGLGRCSISFLTPQEHGLATQVPGMCLLSAGSRGQVSFSSRGEGTRA